MSVYLKYPYRRRGAILRIFLLALATLIVANCADAADDGDTPPGLELFGGMPWDVNAAQTLRMLSARDDVTEVAVVLAGGGHRWGHSKSPRVTFRDAESIDSDADAIELLNEYAFGARANGKLSNSHHLVQHVGFEKAFGKTSFRILARGITLQRQDFLLEMSFVSVPGLILSDPERVIETDDGYISALPRNMTLSSVEYLDQSEGTGILYSPMAEPLCLAIIERIEAKYASNPNAIPDRRLPGSRRLTIRGVSGRILSVFSRDAVGHQYPGCSVNYDFDSKQRFKELENGMLEYESTVRAEQAADEAASQRKLIVPIDEDPAASDL